MKNNRMQNKAITDASGRIGPKGMQYQYHTHKGAWGCIYDMQKGQETIAMVNEFRQPGLTRKIVDRLNTDTM